MLGAAESKLRQRGFSLLEVMVAGVILSSGLAGLAALLLTAVAGTSDAADRSTASLMAASLASLVGISPTQNSVYLATAPLHPADCHGASPCSAAQFAGSNYRAWQLDLASQLPGGAGLMCYDATPEDGNNADPACDNQGALQIKIFWQQRPGSGGFSSRLVKALSP